MDHSPREPDASRAYDAHGRGFDAGVASSSHGPSTSLESSADDDHSASDDMPIDAPLPAADNDLGWDEYLPSANVHTDAFLHRGSRDTGTRGGAATDCDDGDNHARSTSTGDLAAAWYSWMTSPSGTNKLKHLTKRLRTARRAFPSATSSRSTPFL